jgi:hypothetical protein
MKLALSLDFGKLGCDWEAVEQRLESLGRKLHELGLGYRVHQYQCPQRTRGYAPEPVKSGAVASFVLPQCKCHSLT